jgi:hypothetical protein
LSSRLGVISLAHGIGSLVKRESYQAEAEKRFTAARVGVEPAVAEADVSLDFGIRKKRSQRVGAEPGMGRIDWS